MRVETIQGSQPGLYGRLERVGIVAAAQLGRRVDAEMRVHVDDTWEESAKEGCTSEVMRAGTRDD